MALEFNPPAFRQPQSYDYIPKSIDAFYNAYLRSRQMNMDNQRFQQEQQLGQINLQNARGQQVQNQINLGFDPTGVTPDQVQQAYGQAQGAQPGQQLSPIAQAIQLHLNSQRMGARKATAETTGAEADASIKGAEAGMLGVPQPGEGSPQAGGASLIDQHIANQQAGNEDPSMSNFGRGDMANAIRTGVASAVAKRGIDMAGPQAKYDAKIAGAKSSSELTQGGSSQEMARAANSAYKQFDLLQKASDNFSRTNTQLINTPLLEIETMASPEAQVMKTALSTARIEYARAASGSKSPSDTFMQEAKSALPDGITPKQIGPVLDQLRNSLSEQTRGQLNPATIGNAPPLVGAGAPAGAKSLQDQARALLRQRRQNNGKP